MPTGGQPIRLAISTCPNDTFAFHGLMQKKVDCRGLDFQIELLDISELNRGAFAGAFDVAKLSFHAMLHLSDRMVVLPSGSALGFGVGPLLLAASDGVHPNSEFLTAGGVSRPAVVLSPGKYTTAEYLYRLFYPNQGDVRRVVFSEIMPELKQGNADFGICIHEGRFTWRKEGLSKVADLGERWESETQSALPLGGIAADRKIDGPTRDAIQATIRESIEYGMSHRSETVDTMARYAQEFSEDVLFSHVDLYVNEWTVDLGEVGQTALRTMHEKAVQFGVVKPTAPPLRVHASTA